jgi:hypothetical protein
MESCYYYYLLSISFRICVLSPHVVHKGKQETSMGETHHDSKIEFDRKNHKIREAMD